MLKLKTIKEILATEYNCCQNKNAGFTLIELMIVIVIISVIAAIAIPSYQEQVRKGAASQAQQEMQKIAEQLERYKSKNFTYKYFDPKTVYSDDNNAPALTVITVPIGATGDKIKYEITVRDLNEPAKFLTDSSAGGSGWAIQALVKNDAKNYNMLITSTGLRCKTRDSISYTACSGSNVVNW